MFCTKCGAQNSPTAAFCANCGTALTVPEKIASAGVNKPVVGGDIPDGVKGWSWGAFLLNWIWAIGNRTWWGLLAIVPYVGFFVAVWLGIKGREMAWKKGGWDSVEHFNKVQKSWSRWGVIIVLGISLTGILAAIAIPAYQDYVTRAKAKQVELQRPIPSESMASSAASSPTSEHTKQAPSPGSDELIHERLVQTANELNKDLPSTIDKDTRLDTTVVGPGRRFTYNYTLVAVTRADIADHQLDSLEATVKRRTCSTKEMAEFFVNGITVVYKYEDMNGEFLKEVVVAPTDCGSKV